MKKLSVLEAINAVVAYNWTDEEHDYIENEEGRDETRCSRDPTGP